MFMYLIAEVFHTEVLSDALKLRKCSSLRLDIAANVFSIMES